MLSIEAASTNFIVFGLTQPWPDPTTYHTRGEHANHYSTDEIQTLMLIGSDCLGRSKINYHMTAATTVPFCNMTFVGKRK